MAKFYPVVKTINGVEYTAQYNGNSQFFLFQDECKKNIEGVADLNLTKAAKFIFEKVLVGPKNLTIDDFDNFDDCQDVITFGINVMRGEFRGQKDKAGTPAKSEK